MAQACSSPQEDAFDSERAIKRSGFLRRAASVDRDRSLKELLVIFDLVFLLFNISGTRSHFLVLTPVASCGHSTCLPFKEVLSIGSDARNGLTSAASTASLEPPNLSMKVPHLPFLPLR